ncbi:unnamed protein product [Camellia sinensis]
MKKIVDGSSSDRMGLSHHPSDEIHVIVGPMFAEKTTALLRQVESEGNNGRNVAIIKSSKDTRYAVDSVVTHDGTKFPYWALPDLLSFSWMWLALMKFNFLATFMIFAARLLTMMGKL